MTLQEAEIFINAQTFTFAKSYADTYPHEYLQRRNCTDENLYENFIFLIRQNGTAYHFHKKQYIYLNINGFVYWEMGRPIKCVQVLNKAPEYTLIKNNQMIANAYVSNKLKNLLEEREQYVKKLLEKEIKTEKDINQLKFLLNTDRRIHGGGHNIIDDYQKPITYEKTTTA